ncbi:MAG: apolipoprotein N-acyltransferase, partial [Oricola sp.]|nr:apolipoprotein N-acyltransferase [Oricola sp.]
SGPGPETFEVGGTRFSPMICYEAIFPRASYPAGDRPEWLVVVTNDAWFGDSSGPRQHLDMARLRSIETGLPMARSANTGISALIDGKGRVLARIPLYEAGRIDAPLPPALPRPLYDRVGDWLFFLMLLGFLIPALVARAPARVAA